MAGVKEFDVEAFAQERLGGRFAGFTDDGQIKVKVSSMDGSESEKAFNLHGFLSEKGVDPTSLKYKYNSPETALDENAVGFSTAVKLAVGRGKDDLRILQEQYGPDNVQKVGDEIKVKDADGAWKKADTSFLASIAADSPVIAAGIAGTAGGAKLGAAIGSIVPGVGTALGATLGGILGGAVSATFAKYGQIEAAEALGIRSEADAEEVQKELGKEFANSVIWDGITMGTGKILKPLVKGHFGVGKFIKRGLDKFYDREVISETLEKMMPGTKKVDWQVVMQSADDAKQVLKDMDDVVKFKKLESVGKVAPGRTDPATEKMTRMVVGSMKAFKSKASAQFDSAMTTLENAGVFSKAKVDVSDIRVQFTDELAKLGLLDDAGNFIKNPVTDNAKQIMQVFDPKSKRLLQTFYKQLSSVSEARGFSLSAAETRSMLKGIDDILESSGYFNGGDLAITNQTRRTLKGVRAALRKKLGASLENKKVLFKGKLMDAGAVYESATTKYANFRDAYDDFAVQLKDGADKLRVSNTVNRMLGDRGYQLEETFGRMARAVGGDSDKIVTRLKQLRSARNLSDVYSPAQTGLNTVLKQQIGLGSPREIAQLAANRSQTLSNIDTIKQSPVGRSTLAALQATGRMVDFVNKLGGNERMQLFSNPELYRPLLNATFGAAPMQEQLTQQLLQGTGIQQGGAQ